jgi:hypothetical protein
LAGGSPTGIVPVGIEPSSAAGFEVLPIDPRGMSVVGFGADPRIGAGGISLLVPRAMEITPVSLHRHCVRRPTHTLAPSRRSGVSSVKARGRRRDRVRLGGP